MSPLTVNVNIADVPSMVAATTLLSLPEEPVILTEPQKVALQQLELILGQEPASNFKLLLQDRSRIVKFPSSDDKNLRRRVHMAIKEFRSFSILADTIVDERTKEKISKIFINKKDERKN